MPRRFTIGQFGKITGLTPRALRLYAREGLLQPDTINPKTGYRYYAQAQAETAERIRLLRSIDLPLKDIRVLLDQRDARASQDLLRNHKRSIEIRLSRYQEALQTLEALSSRDVGSYSVALKDVAAQPVIYLRQKVPLAQIETTRERAFGELYDFLVQNGLEPTGHGFSSSVAAGQFGVHEALSWNDAWRFDVCVPVAKIIGNQRLKSRVFPAGRVAYVFHTGPYEPLFQVYKKIAAWLSEWGLSYTGQTREIYHRGPAQAHGRNDFKTEVQFYLG